MEPRLCTRRVSGSAPKVTSAGTVYLHVTWGQPLSSARWTSAWRTVSSQKPPAGTSSDRPTCGVHPVDRPLGAPGSQGQGPGTAAAAGGRGAQEAEEEAERVGPAQVGPLHQPVPRRALAKLPQLERPSRFRSLSSRVLTRGGRIHRGPVSHGFRGAGARSAGFVLSQRGALGMSTRESTPWIRGQPGLLCLIRVRLGWLGHRGGPANTSSELAHVTCP